MHKWIKICAISCFVAPSTQVFSAPDVEKAGGGIQLVVGYAAGGTTDIAARQISSALSTHLKRTVEVVNVPGDASTVAPSGFLWPSTNSMKRAWFSRLNR